MPSFALLCCFGCRGVAPCSSMHPQLTAGQAVGFFPTPSFLLSGPNGFFLLAAGFCVGPPRNSRASCCPTARPLEVLLGSNLALRSAAFRVSFGDTLLEKNLIKKSISWEQK